MIGEVSLFGVYIPSLLLLAVIALILTSIAARVLALLSVYRVFAYRPIVDIAVFILILGALALFTVSPDMTA